MENSEVIDPFGSTSYSKFNTSKKKKKNFNKIIIVIIVIIIY